MDMHTQITEYPNACSVSNSEISLSHLMSLAYHDNNQALKTLQEKLSRLHAGCFALPSKLGLSFENMRNETRAAMEIEERMIDYEDRFIDMSRCPTGGNGGDRFVSELRKIIREHPANNHYFYSHYLPNDSTIDDIAFYLTQESALDPRFDDFIALMQIGLSVGPKLELASNYWDEMGNGKASSVHSNLFKLMLKEVGVTDQTIQDNQLVEAIVCGNLSALLALRKPLIYRAIGSFAVTEFLFPRRCSQLIKAWSRNDLSTASIQYHRDHIMIDAHHADGFFRNVIVPCIDDNPSTADEIYWGVMARLNSSERYLDAVMTNIGARKSQFRTQIKVDLVFQ